jgi:predicted acetyltransferase
MNLMKEKKQYEPNKKESKSINHKILQKIYKYKVKHSSCSLFMKENYFHLS